MNDPQDLSFEFNFGSEDRATLLGEAVDTIRALDQELSAAERGPMRGISPADQLLEQLNQQQATFSQYVDIYPLREKHFSEHGLPVPARFRALTKDYNLYWIRFPIFYQNRPNMPFNKIECLLEFNPGEAAGHLRPRALLLLPDRKFKQLLELSDSLTLRIGENFEFEAETGDLSASVGGAGGSLSAGVDVAAAGKLGLTVGPFTYTLKKAQVENSSAGSEKVFWRVTGSEFFQESAPQFVVVLQVPKSVASVRIAGALQAYSHFNLGAAGLSEALKYLGDRLANFFRKGAPVRDAREWDISPSL